jgi:hypothetical protein
MVVSRNESRVSYARGTNDGQQDPFGQSGMEQIGFKAPEHLNASSGRAQNTRDLVSGIYSARSGRAFTVTQGNNNVGADQTGVPNLSGDPKGAETVQPWFNPATFTQVPSGTSGNAGRNILRGPGWITFDMSIQRRIDFNSRMNTTFRLDIFNLFNRANFGLPAANIAANNAGVISSLAGDPRVMQLSVRFGF